MQKVYLDGNVIAGTDLPESRYGHCMVQYKEELFIIGGSKSVADISQQGNNLIGGNSLSIETSIVWKMNITDGSYIQQDSLMYPRSNHACGILHSQAHSGRPLLVVTGGIGTNPKTTEFWDFTMTNSTWQSICKYFFFLHQIISYFLKRLGVPFIGKFNFS